jgi:uncharacterized protein YqgC (DUF456 family)
MMEATLLLKLVFLAIMFVSLVGVFIPLIPALNIIWLVSLIYGILTGFNWVKIVLMVLLTVLMILGNLADNFLMGAKAKQKGASWWSLGAALVAAILFSILLPPFGGLIAAVIALFGVEMLRLKDWKLALESAKGAMIGFGWGVVARLAIGLVMIGLWTAWAFLVK